LCVCVCLCVCVALVLFLLGEVLEVAHLRRND
jgi:hypothetical protein